MDKPFLHLEVIFPNISDLVRNPRNESDRYMCQGTLDAVQYTDQRRANAHSWCFCCVSNGSLPVYTLLVIVSTRFLKKWTNIQEAPNTAKINSCKARNSRWYTWNTTVSFVHWHIIVHMIQTFYVGPIVIFTLENAVFWYLISIMPFWGGQ